MESNNDEEQTLSFIAEWFDPHPQITKKYLLKYYTKTHEIDMKEVSSGRKFLKRTKIEETAKTPGTSSPCIVSPADFYIGATVILLSRDLKLVDYGDNTTRIACEDALEKTVVVVSPPPLKVSSSSSKAHNSSNSSIIAPILGKIIKELEDANLTLVNMKAFRINDDLIEATTMILGLESEDQLKTDGLCCAIELRGKHALSISNSTLEQKHHDYKECGIVTVSSNTEEANLFRDLFLAHAHTPTATYDTKNTTCCVIKPHIIKSQSAGAVLDDILAGRGYDINAIGLYHLERTNAVEFYEVYNSRRIKHYNGMVDEISSGPLIAMEIRDSSTNVKDEDDTHVVKNFRKNAAGPWDVEMAKNLFPDTIRAKFGKNRIQNAIDCTDLAGDNTSEVAYFFDILSNNDEKGK